MTRLALKDVRVRFGGLAALDGVTLEARTGERLAVIGASGAGKSTLFRALTRGVPLSGGAVSVGGRDLYSLPARELRAVRGTIGTIHQAYDLVPQLSAGLNAALGAAREMGSLRAIKTLLIGPGSGLAARARAALGAVGLEEFADTRVADLSGGQQQRVAVARLLVQRPQVVLADEPFAAVDPKTTASVLEALLGLNREGATLLLSSHDVEVARGFPRVVALRAGRVVYDGPPERLGERELEEIYAGTTPRAVRGQTAQTGWARVRVAEGRDGVSAH